MCYLMTTFRCPSVILITSWLFTARWNTWPGNHQLIYRVPCKNCSSSYVGETDGLRIKEHKKEVDSFTAGTQTRASRARESSVTHKSAITDHAVEENHVIDSDKAKSGRQRGTATDQMDKRGILNQKDTDVHESGCRIVPTQPHMGPGDFKVTCSSSCKQSRRDQDVRRTSKRCH